MRGLSERVVIITGGGGGIGSAAARRFVEEGSKVAIFDIDLAAAEGVAAQITGEATINSDAQGGGEARAFACDITDYAAVEGAVASAVEVFGPIDVLVNNAGWDLFRPFLDTEPHDWDKLIAINLTGPLNLHHVVLPGMVERGVGRIVNISSDAGRVGSSGEAVYSFCKAGLIGFSKTLAREHARHGISINVVCPGPTDTNLFAEFRKGAANPEKLDAAFKRSVPMGRIGQPDDLPGAILFLASDDAAYITGQVISVSGGLTMAG